MTNYDTSMAWAVGFASTTLYRARATTFYGEADFIVETLEGVYNASFSTMAAAQRWANELNASGDPYANLPSGSA